MLPFSSLLAALVAALLVILSVPSPAVADEAPRWDLFPEGDPIYPAYLADPRQARTGLSTLKFHKTAIPDAGEQRLLVEIGGTYDMLAIRPKDGEGRGWRGSIVAGFAGVFDQDQSLDNIGWDGIYGLLLHGELTPNLLLKTGLMHRSAHVGDEFKEETNLQRIGYTREELMVALSWWPGESLRLYAEGAYAHNISAKTEVGGEEIDIQKPLRIQAGIEYTGKGPIFGHEPWYLALDVSAFEERDWDPTVSLHAGLLFPAGQRQWRVGLVYVDGSPPIAEFFLRDECRFGLGLWVDF